MQNFLRKLFKFDTLGIKGKKREKVSYITPFGNNFTYLTMFVISAAGLSR